MTEIEVYGSFTDCIEVKVYKDLSRAEVVYPARSFYYFNGDEEMANEYNETMKDYCENMARILVEDLKSYGSIDGFSTDFLYRQTMDFFNFENTIETDKLIKRYFEILIDKNLLSLGKGIELIPPCDNMIPSFYCDGDHLRFLTYLNMDFTGKDFLRAESEKQKRHMENYSRGHIGIFSGYNMNLLHEGIDIKWDYYLNMPESYFKMLYELEVYKVEGTIKECLEAIKNLKEREIGIIESKFDLIY